MRPLTDRICKHEDCTNRLPKGNREYCGRSCAFSATRRKETFAERQQRAHAARYAQRSDLEARMVARVKVLADGHEAQLVLAWRLGKMAAKSARFRDRRHKHAAVGQMKETA